MNPQERGDAIHVLEASLKLYDQARDRRTVQMIAIALHAPGAGEGTLREFTDAVDSARVDFLTQLARLVR